MPERMLLLIVMPEPPHAEGERLATGGQCITPRRPSATYSASQVLGISESAARATASCWKAELAMPPGGEGPVRPESYLRRPGGMMIVSGDRAIKFRASRAHAPAAII